MAKSSLIYRDLYDAYCALEAYDDFKAARGAIERALSHLSALELIAYDLLDAEGKRQSAIARAKEAM